MVYGKFYRKRRNAPKRRLYRKRSGLGVKSVKKICQSVVERGRETKSKQALINQQTIYPYAQGNAGSTDSCILFSLTPNTDTTFPQGQVGLFLGNQAGQRIGNEVQFVKGTMRMMFSANPYNVTLNPNPQPMMVRVFVGYDKTTAHGKPEVDLPEFFQAGNSSRDPASNLTDMFSIVNKDRYVILYTRTVKVGNAEYFGTTTGTVSANTNYYTNNDYKINPVVNINFSKRMRHHVKFQDAAGTAAGRGTWCWLLASPASGTTMVGGALSFQAQLNLEYKDA